jgi:hypothetical protein
VENGKAATSCANLISTCLLWLSLSFKAKEKSSNLAFIPSKVLSLEISLLTIVSLILACSMIKSLRVDCWKLGE